MTRVLTVNPGSGSLRVHLVEAEQERVLESAAVDLSTGDARDELGDVLRKIDAPEVVAHRLVHGGPSVVAPTVVDDSVLAAVRGVAGVAPQHVPKTLSLLDFLRDRLPDVMHVVCPDTAFHAELPEVARTYPVPRSWREQWGLRRYGFHGLSFSWALRRAAALLGRSSTQLDLLIAHLSGGCSVCAVRGGRSVDTSMGFTPLEGLMMSKRSGSVDPGMLLWLLREGKLSVEELGEGLESRSGLLGLSDGYSTDTRDLVAAAGRGDSVARFALDVFTHRVRREVAGLAASLGRVEGLVFTGDIGWNQPEVVEDVCAGLGVLGVRGGLDVGRRCDGVVSRVSAGVPVVVVQAREELSLASAAVGALC